MNTSTVPQILRTTLLLANVIMAGFLMIYLESLLKPFVLAILLTLALIPVCAFLEGKGFSRSSATFLSLFFTLIVLLLIFFVFFQQGSRIAQDWPVLEKQLESKMGGLNEGIKDLSGLDIRHDPEMLKSMSDMGKNLLSGLFSSLSNLAGLLLSLFYVAFMLLYRGGFRKFLMIRTTSNNQAKMEATINASKLVIQQYFKGWTTVMLIVSTLNTIGLWIIGVDYPIMFGFLAGLLSIIPVFGILIGGGLATIYAWLTHDDTLVPIFTIGVFWIVQLLEGYVLTPKITGSSVNINPLMSTIGLLVGSWIWGPMGMIMSIPIMAIAKVVLDNWTGYQPYGFLLGEQLGATSPKRSKRKKAAK